MKYFSSTLTQGLQSCQIASPTNRKWRLRKCGNNTDKEIEKGVFTLKAGTLAEQGMQSLRNQREKRHVKNLALETLFFKVFTRIYLHMNF